MAGRGRILVEILETVVFYWASWVDQARLQRLPFRSGRLLRLIWFFCIFRTRHIERRIRILTGRQPGFIQLALSLFLLFFLFD